MKNLKLEISERDKKLLMILIAVGIIFCSYYFGFQKLSAQTDKYEAQVTTLTKKERELKEKTANKAKYQTDAANLNKEFTAGLSQFGTLTSQPSQLDFMNRVERIAGVWIKSITFSESEPIYQFSQSISTGETAMTGYKTTLTLSYEGKYEQWKNLLTFLNGYETKNTIDNISMTYESGEGIVSGAMTVTMYAIQGGDRKAMEPEFPVNTGTDNIFNHK